MSNPFQKPPLKKNEIEWAINQTKSMTQASLLLHCSYNTFKKWAKIYEIWNPNQSGKGIRKPKNKFKKGQSDPMLFHRTEEQIESFKQRVIGGVDRD
tara:strand:+ start:229 stop:519 length:291 start_codon:yes stop_codon:yes gene_type:complete